MVNSMSYFECYIRAVKNQFREHILNLSCEVLMIVHFFTK